MEVLVKFYKCLELKPRNSFTIRLDRKSGLRSSCKSCSNIVSNDYKKTKEGLIRKILVQQKRSSEKRLHIPPKYSLDELRDWFYLQSNFNDLYNNWVSSNYDKNLTPSVDRKNDLEPYTFENIRLITWEDNCKKSHEDKLNGVTGRDMKKVYQYDSDFNLIATYHSTAFASKQLGVSQSTISNRCRNNLRLVKGFYWSYDKLN